MGNFIWETLRRYPPAAGVPQWITQDEGVTWEHQIANVQQALQDPTVYPEPLEYRLGRPGLKYGDTNLSIGFADFAMVNSDVSDPRSHSCPGKQFTLSLLATFLREFSAFNWAVDNADI